MPRVAKMMLFRENNASHHYGGCVGVLDAASKSLAHLRMYVRDTTLAPHTWVSKTIAVRLQSESYGVDGFHPSHCWSLSPEGLRSQSVSILTQQ